MRIALDNGNGMRCDRCGKELKAKSQDIVKCLCQSPHLDDKKASSGYMQTIGKVDLCKDCYDDILGNLIRTPRHSKRYE